MGGFNNPLSSMDRSSIWKLNRKILDLTDIINQMDLTDIYRTFNLKKEYTFFSIPHETFLKIDHILNTK